MKMKRTLFYVTAIVSLILFAACSKDDSNDLVITSSKEVGLTSQETSQIKCSDPKATYASEDEFVATVSETGLITAKRIGETYIDINGKKSVKVTIRPVYTQFVEPQFLFGATKEDVYSKVGTNYYSSDDTGISYIPSSGKVKYYSYLLKDGKVSSVGMIVSTDDLESITNFLLERYVPISLEEEDYTAVLANALTEDKITMLVAEKIYSVSYIFVVYLPYSSSASRSSIERETLEQQVQHLMDKINLSPFSIN